MLTVYFQNGQIGVNLCFWYIPCKNIFEDEKMREIAKALRLNLKCKVKSSTRSRSWNYFLDDVFAKCQDEGILVRVIWKYACEFVTISENYKYNSIFTGKHIISRAL